MNYIMRVAVYMFEMLLNVHVNEMLFFKLSKSIVAPDRDVVWRIEIDFIIPIARSETIFLIIYCNLNDKT